jgi:hypothetical protein
MICVSSRRKFSFKKRNAVDVIYLWIARLWHLFRINVVGWKALPPKTKPPIYREGPGYLYSRFMTVFGGDTSRGKRSAQIA